MARKRRDGPIPLVSVLREQVRALGWERKFREQEVLGRWEEAVGPQIAAHSRPLQVRNRRLTVAVDNPAWSQQLTLLKKDLLQRLHRLLGPGVIEDLYFTGGRIEPERRESEPPPEIAPPLSPEECRAIDREASLIPDSGLREAFRKALLAASRRSKPPPQGAPTSE